MAKKRVHATKRAPAHAGKKVRKFAKMKPASRTSGLGMRPPTPAGYVALPSGLIAPSQPLPVPTSKMRAGLRAARQQLDDSLDELLSIVAGPYRIASIELEISFSADGKFLGFGVGGATSMKLTIEPE